MLTYTLSDITETGDNGDLTGEHDIGGSLDTIDEGLSASVLSSQLGIPNRSGIASLRSCRTWTW